MGTNPKGAVKNLADTCVQEILEMSEDEILREYEEDNLDPEEEAERIREVINEAIDKAAEKRRKEAFNDPT